MMMRLGMRLYRALGVRGAFIGTIFLLVVLGDITGGLFLEQRLRQEFRANAATELHRAAVVTIEILAARLVKPTTEEVDAVADRVSTLIGTRITIIDTDGTVLGDSSLDGAELRTIDNHANRPEVIGALADGESSSTRYSSTLETDMLYLARSYVLKTEPNSRLLVRVARPLSELDEQIITLRYILLLAGMMTLIPIAVAGGLLSSFFSRRVRSILSSAPLRSSLLGGSTSSSHLEHESLTSSVPLSFIQVSEDLENAMEVLADERDRFQIVLESMHEAVIALDSDGRISLANRAARMLLVLQDNAHGKRLHEITSVEELRELSSSDSEDSTSVEFVVTTAAESDPGPSASPSRRTVLARATRQTDGGTVIVMHDVTEVRRLETIRRDFVANVSHELRTPVSIIRANAETLLSLESSLSAQERRFLEALFRHADRLGRLITDLLDISKIEVGKYPITPEPTKLSLLAQRSIESVEHKASTKGMALVCEIPERMIAMADPKALEQVMLNLAENAVKYGTDDCTLIISAEERDGRVLLEFVDDGPGIEPMHRPRIFERFYRVDPGRSREMGGTGLGLAIVKHLVEAMDGSVGVVANEPRGSRFWVSLPPDESTATSTESAKTDPSGLKSS